MYFQVEKNPCNVVNKHDDASTIQDPWADYRSGRSFPHCLQSGVSELV